MLSGDLPSDAAEIRKELCLNARREEFAAFFGAENIMNEIANIGVSHRNLPFIRPYGTFRVVALQLPPINRAGYFR